MLRKTKIICTLGPAVDSEEMIEKLIEGGMDGARFNFSHGSHATHKAQLDRLKSVRKRLGRPVAAILDTRGPEIRIRDFACGSVELKKGDRFVLTTGEAEGDCHRVSVTYPELHEELTVGQKVLVDDGLICLSVEALRGQDILCRVENGGVLSGRKSINIPGAHVSLPALTQQDVEDLRLGVEQGFDYVAASFVRRAEDVRAVRRVLDGYGGEEVRIIAKIENQEGVDNFDAILREAEGIMVARGDLGVEVPAAVVPILQKQMIRKGQLAGKPVITATQMLDSMIRNPRPTRAEVSDVANAVYDGTSCVMLSGETAGGAYPIQAVEAMARVVVETERAIRYWDRFRKRRLPELITVDDAITHSACLTAMDLQAKAILAPTHTGHTARMIARFRPQCPVVALTGWERVRRRLSICWGVVPLLMEQVQDTDRLFEQSACAAVEQKLATRGEVVVITAGIPLGRTGSTNLVKAHTIQKK